MAKSNSTPASAVTMNETGAPALLVLFDRLMPALDFCREKCPEPAGEREVAWMNGAIFGTVAAWAKNTETSDRDALRLHAAVVEMLNRLYSDGIGGDLDKLVEVC